MLLKLPQLPFLQIIDILFRHEGISGLERCFKGKGLFIFLRRYYDTKFSDIICACHIARRVWHPAHVIYLHCAAEESVIDSKEAWSVFNHYDSNPPQTSLLIHAMRCFLSDECLIYEWLHPADLRVTRTHAQWKEFTLECIRNHQFTKRWWTKGDIWWCDGEDMINAIRNAATEEFERLQPALYRVEKLRILRAKKKKISKLPFADEQSARMESEQSVVHHRNVLIEVKYILSRNISTNTLNSKFDHVARLIMSLTHCYPKIKWSLILLLHNEAIGRLGIYPWHVERELDRQKGFKDPEPLHYLRYLV